MCRENLHAVYRTIAEVELSQTFIKELNEFSLILLADEKTRRLTIYAIRNYLLNKKYPVLSKTLENVLSKIENRLLED